MSSRVLLEGPSRQQGETRATLMGPAMLKASLKRLTSRKLAKWLLATVLSTPSMVHFCAGW